ncbi:MAG: MarR family winged helix-turn-helix transcriptional regulator [Corynebacterium sp.]|uniref:MarR family winged helix-turn-helix transcriptional regulator n=1 Tax=Corynebacterium sp. TaxID=1720 RepID=UPI0026DC032C|nr:MarR family winged helix-turn-helix transcriptional regulator [Corynebacterium sp.]MDO5029426.1 MarR family winged helix-turn-helix transcriptional regulator [Corynebacterium sp.]
MNPNEWLTDDEQNFWQTMVQTFREVERNIERSLRQRTGMTFADFTLLIALHETEDGILHVDQICDRLKWNHPRALLHTNRLEKRGFIHTEEHGEDPDSDYVVVLTGVGRTVFAEAAPDYVDTVRTEVIEPLADVDREMMMKCFHAVLGR